MRRWLGIGISMTILLTLAGCGPGSVQDALGMGKRSPDEFAVGEGRDGPFPVHRADRSARVVLLVVHERLDNELETSGRQRA